MTVLSIIVVVMAALFQQTSVAWKGGDAKSKRYSLMRAALGILERDLASAVDPRIVLPTLDDIGDLNFSRSSLTFYTFRSPARDDKNKDSYRTIYRIKYSLSGNAVNRTEEYWADGDFKGGSSVNLLEGSFDGDSGGITLHCDYIDAITGRTVSSVTEALPAAVRIHVSIANSAFESYDVGVMSLGPDGDPDTDDDVRVGPQE